MTSPNHNDARKLLQVIGQVDVFEDSTASDTAISVFTADGDEYVIVARKIVKRLLRFAGEEIDIEFLGYVTHDASAGLDVLNVVSFKPTSEEDNKTTADTASDYDRNSGPKKRKKAIVQELDDEDVNAEDFDQAEGFDTIIIHDDDLADLPLDDDEDPPTDDDDIDLNDDDIDLNDDDIDLSVLNAIVNEAMGKAVAASSEPTRDADTAVSPTEKPSPTAKKIPRPQHAQNKTAPRSDTPTDPGRQTAKTQKEKAVKRDQPPAAKTPKTANQNTTSGESPVLKTVKAVDAKTPAQSEARKDTKARTAPKPTQKQKTPPPTTKAIPGQTPAATKTPRQPDSVKHTAAPPAPAPRKKSPSPPAKQVADQAPKKAAAKPTSKKVPGQAPKATRPQNDNGAAAAKKQPKTANTKASATVAPTAPKTAPKSSGPARSRKRPS